ncbi:MAG: GlsB/YeaQ/YmgE family stress response membrane protein [Gammaproteobacteria bacterium]|nr:GlsB/YeaQ/YmgE family stress response membrane protein [Gammaproteobacteria bacterium]MDH3534309.1 GlsB/YeaQ/YmgE family stress response membrane protein [Gammaproteobacteria bacterium]
MNLTDLVIFLAIGAVAGWLAGALMKRGGFGLLGNIIVGIVGAVVGGFVFGLLGIAAGGLVGSIITATVGAVILIFAVRIIKKA